MEGLGRPNFVDYFTAFRLIDPQGIRWNMKIYFDKLFDIFEGIINQRLQSKSSEATIY